MIIFCNLTFDIVVSLGMLEIQPGRRFSSKPQPGMYWIKFSKMIEDIEVD